jgi:hypothetical protein
VPADQCTPCFIDEKEKNALIADAPGRSRSTACVVEANGIRGSALLFDLDHSHAAFRGWLAAALRNRQPPIELSERVETALTHEEARALQTSCEQRIDERLRAYEPTGGLPAGFSSTRSFSWRGVEHSIQTLFDPVGEEIGQLLGAHGLLGEALAGGVLHLFGRSSEGSSPGTERLHGRCSRASAPSSLDRERSLACSRGCRVAFQGDDAAGP